MGQVSTPRNAQPAGTVPLATYEKTSGGDRFQGVVAAFLDGSGNPIEIDSTNKLPVAATVSGSVAVTGTVSVSNIASTVSVSVGNFPATQPVSGTVNVGNTVAVSGPLTDTQLRASAVPVSGPLTDTELRASSLVVSGPLTDSQLRATAVPVSGTVTVGNIPSTQTVSVSNASLAVTGPLTDTQLRASAVTVSDNHTTAASPLSVRLSDGSAFYNASGGGGSSDTTATGTINANGQEVLISSANGLQAVSVQVSGTYSGTLALQIRHSSGDSWVNVSGTNFGLQSTGGYTAGAGWSPGTTGVISIYAHGAGQLRITSTAWTSGTATISLRANSAGPMPLLGSVPSGTAVIGAVNQNGTWNVGQSGTWNVGSISTSIVPGTAATNLGKAEDAVHASGDTGVFALSVRRDTLNTTYPASASGDYQQISSDRHGAVLTQVANGRKPTTSAAITFTPAASATDILTIEGAVGQSTRISRITISGVQTTAGSVLFALIYRNGTNTGGTSTTVTNVYHDSADMAGFAVIRAYTANPTLGGTVGYLRQRRHFIPAASTATPSPPLVWDFGASGKEVSVATGTLIAVSLEGATITGGSLSIEVEYYHE